MRVTNYLLNGMILQVTVPPRTGSFEPNAKGKGGGNVGPASWRRRHAKTCVSEKTGGFCGQRK